MRITREQFNKLNQLDRIEYRQRLRNIREEWNYFPNMIYYVVLFTAVIVLDCWYFLRIGKWISLVYINLVLKVLILFIVIEIILSLVFSLLKHIEINKLEKEYFEIKHKEKK